MHIILVLFFTRLYAYFLHSFYMSLCIFYIGIYNYRYIECEKWFVYERHLSENSTVYMNYDPRRLSQSRYRRINFICIFFKLMILEGHSIGIFIKFIKYFPFGCIFLKSMKFEDFCFRCIFLKLMKNNKKWWFWKVIA